MKALVGFNQEKALVGAFSVIVQLHRLIDLRHYLQQQRLNFGLIIPSVGNCSVDIPAVGCLWLLGPDLTRCGDNQLVKWQSFQLLCCALLGEEIFTGAGGLAAGTLEKVLKLRS